MVVNDKSITQDKDNNTGALYKRKRKRKIEDIAITNTIYDLSKEIAIDRE